MAKKMKDVKQNRARSNGAASPKTKEPEANKLSRVARAAFGKKGATITEVADRLGLTLSFARRVARTLRVVGKVSTGKRGRPALRYAVA